MKGPKKEIVILPGAFRDPSMPTSLFSQIIILDCSWKPWAIAVHERPGLKRVLCGAHIGTEARRQGWVEGPTVHMAYLGVQRAMGHSCAWATHGASISGAVASPWGPPAHIKEGAGG